MKLENKIAIVTGGAKGIGKATVIKFVKEGAIVDLWDLDEKSGNELVKELEQIGYKTSFQRVDVSKIDQVENAVKNVIDQYSKVDVLVNNAGITMDASLKKMTPDQWHLLLM